MATEELTAGCSEDFDRLVRQEELILDVTETLTQALESAGVTRAELARRLGRSPGFVSQVFGGGRNLTLRTIADICSALSVRPALTLSPEGETRSESAAPWICEIQPWRLELEIAEGNVPAFSSLAENPRDMLDVAFHAAA